MNYLIGFIFVIIGSLFIGSKPINDKRIDKVQKVTRENTDENKGMKFEMQSIKFSDTPIKVTISNQPNGTAKGLSIGNFDMINPNKVRCAKCGAILAENLEEK